MIGKIKKIKHITVYLLLAFCLESAHAQVKIGDNKQAPTPGAVLELESAAPPYKGLLMTKIPLSSTTAWGLAGNPTAGMIVYNTNIAITTTDSVNYPVVNGGTGLYTFDGRGWKGLVYTSTSNSMGNGTPKILSQGRVKGTGLYSITANDVKVTSDCIIVYTFETNSIYPTPTLQTRVPGVSFTVVNGVSPFGTDVTMSYMLIEK